MRKRHGPAVIDVHHVGARQTGNETWSANVARELAALDTDGSCVFAVGSEGRAEVEALTGRPPQMLPRRSIVRLTVGLPRLLRQVRSRACLVSYTPPLAFRTPLVIAIHDLSAFDVGAAAFLSRRVAARYRFSIRLAAHRAGRIVVPTRHTADDLVRYTGFAREHIVVAAIPVDPGLKALLVAPRLDRLPVFRVLMVGTVLPRKNLRVVADAIAILLAAGLEVHLRVAGPVRAAGRADEAYLNETLGERVSWTAYLSTEDLAREYLGADVLAFPSLYEGFGIPVIEAMTAGLPVVASNASCLPEVLGDAGLMADPHDAVAWATAIRRLLDDPDTWNSYAARGRVRAAEFTWTESARSIYAAIVDVGR